MTSHGSEMALRWSFPFAKMSLNPTLNKELSSVCFKISRKRIAASSSSCSRGVVLFVLIPKSLNFKVVKFVGIGGYLQFLENNGAA